MTSDPTPNTAAAERIDLAPLVKFEVTTGGGLRCFACWAAKRDDDVPVPTGYRGMLAWLIRVADNHNREVHPDGAT